MSNKLLLLTSSTLIALFILSCNLVAIDEEPEVYPTRIAPLSSSALEKKNTDYQVLNNERVCSTLNEYGFTGFSRVLFPNDINPCLDREIIRIELTDTDTLVNHALETVLKNALYTGVPDSSSLFVEESVPLFGCTICEGPELNNVIIGWKVTFEAQIAEGLTVESTEISVFMDAFGVNRIWGNWYSNFYNPERPNIQFDAARLLLIGQQLNLQTDNLNVTFDIKDNYITTEETIAIRPFQNDGNLELRKGYVILINNPELPDENWEAFIDVMDGRVLSLEKI